MATEPKYIKVLIYLYERHTSRKGAIWYQALTPLVFNEDTIKRYSHARNRKSVIDTMTTTYLGRIAAKGYINAEYKFACGRAYFNGYTITKKGIDKLKSLNLI